MTDRSLLIWIIIGGVLEFLGAQASTIAFNSTLSAGMNGGIVGAIIALNSVFVMICAFFMFGESLSKIKFVCMLLLMGSVVLVSLFPPDNIANSDDMLVQNAGIGGVDTSITDSNLVPRLTQDELLFHQIVMIVGGLIASASFGSQLLVFKHCMKYTQDTFSIGFGFLFSCGLLGVISLVVQSLRQPFLITTLPLGEIIGPLVIGLCTAMAIVLANIGAGIGIAGVSNSIIHCSLVIVTTFNYFVFNQPLSLLQVLGVFMTVGGGVLLATEDHIEKGRKKKGTKIMQHVNDIPIL